MNLNYIVKNKDDFFNLKELLKTYFFMSDRLILKLKKENRFLVNNQVVTVNSKISTGDVVDIKIDFNEDDSEFPSVKMDLDIIYEDEAFLVINKPAGIPVHPSLNHYEDSLANGVKYYLNSKNIHKKIRPVNRLDKDTSGIVIFAKNEYIQECLVKQMKSNNFKKEYIAICNGIFNHKSAKIDKPIARKENSIIERCINTNGSPSVTYYDVIEENTDLFYSIVKCKLETGRTHQIRVHLQSIGHPILGDTLYGTSSNLINRQALHSYIVSFIHPITKQNISFTAPLPNDMLKLCGVHK